MLYNYVAIRDGVLVGIFDKVERGLERAVNGAFARTFKSGLQPVEIAAALKRELDVQAVVLDRDRILAPNQFFVRLSSNDSSRMARLGSALVEELISIVNAHAQRQNFQFAGPVSIAFSVDSSLPDGVIDVDSNTVKGQVDWVHVLEYSGHRSTLMPGETIIGRSQDATLTLNDTGASRHHAALHRDGRQATIRDLGSTNGTQLNGTPVAHAVLQDGDEILIGQTRMIYRVLPQSVQSRGTQSRVQQQTTRTQTSDSYWGV